MRKLHLTRGKIILALTLFLNLAFIFVHASFSPAVSGAEIDAVGSVLGGVFSTKDGFGAFLQRNVSNIAHFCEYGLLGGQIAIAVFLWIKERVKFSVISVGFAAFIALLDETVQIFSGRHSSVVDLWIDVLGYSLVLTVTLVSLTAVKAIRKKRAISSRGKE